MILRHKIYILALLLIVTSLCVWAEEAQGTGDNRALETESEIKLFSQIEKKIEPPPPGNSGPQGPAGNDGPPVTCPSVADGATVGSCPPAAAKLSGVHVP
ncbi:uncharacterized protein TM35_000551100, partial [Trypanosoma theileri]